MDERAHLDAQPINPQLIFAELSPRLPDNCILTSDSGSATNWWARHLRMRTGMNRRCRARWRRCARPCPTRWERSSLIPTGR